MAQRKRFRWCLKFSTAGTRCIPPSTPRSQIPPVRGFSIVMPAMASLSHDAESEFCRSAASTIPEIADWKNTSNRSSNRSVLIGCIFWVLRAFQCAFMEGRNFFFTRSAGQGPSPGGAGNSSGGSMKGSSSGMTSGSSSGITGDSGSVGLPISGATGRGGTSVSFFLFLSNMLLRF